MEVRRKLQEGTVSQSRDKHDTSGTRARARAGGRGESCRWRVQRSDARRKKEEVAQRGLWPSLLTSIARHDEEHVRGRQCMRVDLRLSGHTKVLRHRVADRAGERCAGIAAVGCPYAGRVAVLVDLLAQSHVPVVVDRHEAFEHVHVHDPGPGLLDPVALVPAIRRLVVGQRLVAGFLEEHGAGVAHVAHPAAPCMRGAN